MARTETQDLLLLTAERLFAQEGIDAVSTRRIAQAAGQRNISALQYHFGSKDQLIDELLALRLAVINRRREALLEEQAQAGRADVHALLTALVLPLTEELALPDSHFIGFLQQLYGTARGDNVYANQAPELTSGLNRISLALCDCLAYLPRPVLELRLRLMGSQLVHSTGDWYYQRERGEFAQPLPLMSANLIDFLAGALLAPVSATVSALLTPSQ